MSYDYMQNTTNHTYSNYTRKTQTNTGNNRILIHYKRRQRMKNFKYPIRLTNDELQDYILYNKLPLVHYLEVPIIKPRKKYTYGNYCIK